MVVVWVGGVGLVVGWGEGGGVGGGGVGGGGEDGRCGG